MAKKTLTATEWWERVPLSKRVALAEQIGVEYGSLQEAMTGRKKAEELLTPMQFWDQSTTTARRAIAAQVGIGYGYFYESMTGRKILTLPRAQAIFDATGGAVEFIRRVPK